MNSNKSVKTIILSLIIVILVAINFVTPSLVEKSKALKFDMGIKKLEIVMLDVSEAQSNPQVMEIIKKAQEHGKKIADENNMNFRKISVENQEAIAKYTQNQELTLVSAIIDAGGDFVIVNPEGVQSQEGPTFEKFEENISAKLKDVKPSSIKIEDQLKNDLLSEKITAKTKKMYAFIMVLLIPAIIFLCELFKKKRKTA